MPVFITYARKDRAAVEALARDLDRSHNAVWLDQELTGGQAWWDAILGQIRACDLYVFAVSPESLRSRACKSELEYALAVRRPLLPVLIQDVVFAHAPPAIANTQIVDYRVRTIDNGIALISAVANRPAVSPLPDPLPMPPGPPMSYMNQFAEILDAPYLTYQEQNHLLADLRGYLGADEDDRNAAVQLIRGLRHRRDVAEGIAREIDQMLGPYQPPPPARRGPYPVSAPTPSPSSASTLPLSRAQPGPSLSQPAYHAQAQALAPRPLMQASPQTPPSAKALRTGLFVTLLMVAAFIPLAGLVAGLVLLANAARRSQGIALIVCSVVGFVIWGALLSY